MKAIERLLKAPDVDSIEIILRYYGRPALLVNRGKPGLVKTKAYRGKTLREMVQAATKGTL